jgi:xanthine dehydrogenase accessory factor
MMDRHREVFERIVTLQKEGSPFVLATVVARRAPVSAHVGDHAIVFGDGRMDGFIGGACARELVRRQALEALRMRQGRLVSIRPDAVEVTESTGEHTVLQMTCTSEGAVDVYIEPFVQASELLIVGATPVADALARLARAMDYAVTRVVDARERADFLAAATPSAAAVTAVPAAPAAASGMTPSMRIITLDELDAALQRAGASDRAAVVASQGHYDEEALEPILRAGLSYVGLLASRQRGATVRAFLEEKQVPGVSALRSPVGLDIGARTPHEVALSILADIVQVRAEALRREPAVADAPALPDTALADMALPDTALDPVCGMDVDVATARHTADVDGITYYFCCPHCRELFVKHPQEFLRSAS